MNILYKNKGFSIVGAIFVLVILSLLGLAMLTINAVLQTSSAQSTGGIQAYYTAVSGLEWATYQATSRCEQDHDAVCGNPNPMTSTFDLNGFTVTAECENYGGAIFDDNNGNGPYQLETITVTARRIGPLAGSPDQISRTLRATITRSSELPQGISCISSL